jgi:hypothetical protein
MTQLGDLKMRGLGGYFTPSNSRKSFPLSLKKKKKKKPISLNLSIPLPSTSPSFLYPNIALGYHPPV